MPSSLRTLPVAPGSVPDSCLSVTRSPSRSIACPSLTSAPTGPSGGSAAALATLSISGTPDPKVHVCDSDTRSFASVVLATRQPPLTSPTTQSSGTNTSSRKTWLKRESPVISRSGRTSTPGE